MSETRKATLYRMVLPEETCPYGQKSLGLLRRHGFGIEDHRLTSRAEVDEFKKQHGVKTTPQTFIDGNRIGGYDALVDYFR